MPRTSQPIKATVICWYFHFIIIIKIKKIVCVNTIKYDRSLDHTGMQILCTFQPLLSDCQLAI